MDLIFSVIYHLKFWFIYRALCPHLKQSVGKRTKFDCSSMACGRACKISQFRLA